MPELREDPSTGAWCILSGERGHRPVRVRPPSLAEVLPKDCPFCPGHEAVTLPTLDAEQGPHGWLVRAFPNRYPALRIEGIPQDGQDGPFRGANGIGAHEVIAESPLHDLALWSQPGQMRLALAVACRRLADLHRDARLQHVTWFRNHGALAGASQPHPHAQIVGSVVVPRQVSEMASRFAHHLARTGRPLMQEIVRHELKEEVRMVGRVGDMVVLCPYAPAFAWEMWIVPEGGGARFFECGEAAVIQLADALTATLRALDDQLGPPAHNVVLHTAPRGAERGFGWHLRVMPRRVALGGYELMSGGTMLHTSPEESAAALRGAFAVTS